MNPFSRRVRKQNEFSVREQDDVAIALLNGTSRHRLACMHSITQCTVMRITMDAIRRANLKAFIRMSRERGHYSAVCLRVPDMRAHRHEFLPQLTRHFPDLDGHSDG